MPRVYRIGPWRAEDENGQPAANTDVTVWISVEGGTQATNLETLDGDPIADGILTTDSWGFITEPGFVDLDDNPHLYIIGSATGEVDGVRRAYLHPGDTAERVTDLEGRVDVLEQEEGSSSPLRIDDLTWPQVIAHRGSDATVPENTLEAFAAAVDEGCQLVELDVWLGADGSLVVLHDADLSRTHGASIDVSSMTAAATNRYPVDSGLLGFDGWPDLKMPTLADVFSRFAGAPVCWLVEIKTNGLSSAALTAAGEAVVDLVQRYGLEESVIVQSFDQDAVTPAIAAGIPGGYIEADGGTDPATIAANGFEYYGVRQDAPSSAMADIQAAGLRLLVYTVNRHVDRDAALAEGADGIVTDQPLYLRDDYTPGSSALFELATWAHGHLISPVTDEPGTFNAGGYELDRSDDVIPNYSADTLGQISPIADPTSFTLTCNMEILAADDANDSGQIQLCANDVGYDDNDHARVNAYNILIRQNGDVDIYRADGTAERINRETGDTVDPSTVLTVTVEVTSSTITVTRSGQGADVVNTINDTSFRPPYVSIGARDAHVRFSNLSVT